jgi:hypothetical protein
MIFRNRAPPKLIRRLLKADVNHDSITTKTQSHGRIPLHIALLCRLPFNSLQVLLDYDTDKRSVFVQDDYGKLALEYAWYQHSTDRTATTKSTIELVFQSMLHARVEQVGMYQWKNEVLHKMIRPLQYRQLECTRRADFQGTACFLEETCNTLNLLLEKAILLELVAWKMVCVREYGLMPPALNDRQKSECRITSGVDVIVPGVISFLENEPVISLLASDCLPPVEQITECDLRDIDFNRLHFDDVLIGRGHQSQHHTFNYYQFMLEWRNEYYRILQPRVPQPRVPEPYRSRRPQVPVREPSRALRPRRHRATHRH